MPNFKRTKLACYSSYFTMSSIFSVPPILFVTFQNMYDISYTLLGTLVLVNFFTQLSIDLIFTVFSKHFNIKKILRIMPLITTVGLIIYALVPWLAPSYAYAGLLVGTVIFSVSAGLSEVLLSPIIAAIPSKNPQRDMSLLHSLYGCGVFATVVISTLFLRIFSTENWMYLVLFWAALPIISAVLFMTSPIPEMKGDAPVGKVSDTGKRAFAMSLFVACIFLGSCAENAMTNWISGYVENALKLDKTMGDILGMALFAVLLAATRMAYAKFGKNILRMLFIGMIGSAVCYLIVALSSSSVVSFAACVLIGIFSSMLWPGTLIMMEERLVGVGVAAYALMAAGGDLGASIAPQLLGIVTDTVSASPVAETIGTAVNLTAEQVGLKAGMLVNSVFPILGIVVLIVIARYFKKKKLV